MLVKQSEAFRIFVCGVNLTVFTQCSMESKKFHLGFFLQLYVIVYFGCREEVKDVYFFGCTSDTVHTPDSLHQPGRVPRRIVIDDDIGTMQVYTFCQNLGRNDDIIIILFLTFIIGIEISFKQGHFIIPIVALYGQYAVESVFS